MHPGNIFGLFHPHYQGITPVNLETELLRALLPPGLSAAARLLRGQMRLMLAASIVLEGGIFYSGIYRHFQSRYADFLPFSGCGWCTWAGILRLYQFFRGRLKIKELFNWRMERISCCTCFLPIAF